MQAVLNAEAQAAQARYELDAISKTIARREKEREDTIRERDRVKQLLSGAPALEQEMLGLAREYETRKQQVANLQARQFNAEMAASAIKTSENDIYRVLDEANMPERPVFPARVHIVLMGIAAGLVAGVVAAFTREYFEPSLGTEHEIATVLKLPVLVSVPEIQERPRAMSR